MSKEISRLSIALLLTLCPATGLADTARMEKVASQLGIDDGAATAQAQEAESAVKRLVALGLQAYPTLKEREAELAQRRYEREAAVAGYQPKFSVVGNLTRQDGKDTDSRRETQADGSDINLVLRQNIWRGGQDSGLVEISEQNQVLAEIGQSYEQESLAFAIQKAALDYNYRALQELIDEVSYQDAAELRGLADRKLEAGQVGKIDIYTTSMRESAAKASAARAAIETRQARERLLALLGPVDPVAVEKELSALRQRTLPYPRSAPILEGEGIKTFEQRNAEVIAKRADISLDQGFRQRFYPQIDLVGQLGRSKNRSTFDLDDDVTTNTNTTGTYVQLQLNWQLYDRSADYTNKATREARVVADAQGATAQYRAQAEVQRIRIYIQDLYRNLSSVNEAYKASGQLYDAQRRLYETGVIGIQALIDAEAEKRNAIGNWHQNVYELQLNLLIWEALKDGYLPPS